MIINFEMKTKTLWHSDCDADGSYSPPMKELEIDNDKERTLMECTRCEKKGFYPHGGSGCIEVDDLEVELYLNRVKG